MSLTPEQQQGIDNARELIAGGIPVFAARPAMRGGEWDPTGGTDGCGYWLPTAWQKTVPSENWLNPNAPGFESKAWRPGWALGAVMGHGLDLLDVDPRNRGDATREALVQAGMWPRTYGAANTPSGGTHEFVASMNVGSRDDLRPGLDIKGGMPDGSSRGFAFIQPTVKASKVTGEMVMYQWTTAPDLDALTDGDDDSGEGIAEMVRAARGNTTTSSSSSAAGADPFDLSDAPSRWPHQGPIADGARYPDLRSYAGSLRRRDVHLDEALHLMRLRWQDCAQPPNARHEMPWRDAEALLRDIYGRYAPASPDAEVATAPEQAPDGAESASEASWRPVDLTAYLDGSYVAVEPTLLRRVDGVALLYPGLVHSFHGESESGKSLLLQIEAARLVADGEDVLFIDFESDAASVGHRLVTFGAPAEAVLKHFHYIRPQSSPAANLDERAAFTALLEQRYALAVIDGVTDALTIFNFKTKENDDITAWMRSFPRRIADRTGAAVALVDHVTKDSDTRGRFAIGGQAKMNGLTGAAYVVDIGEALGKGMRGEIVLRVAKDRVGQVRPHCGPMRKSDRTQEAARIVIDSRGPSPAVSINPHRDSTTGDIGGPGGFRPTVLMERLSLAAERTGGLSKNKLADEAAGKNRKVTLDAIDLLVEEGYLRQEPGAGNSQRHYSVRPYRRAVDALDPDYFEAGTTQSSDTGGSGSSPYTGELGTTIKPVLGTTSEPPGTTTPQGHWNSLEEGPCATCQKPTKKYGPGGHKQCPDCRRIEAAGA